VDVGGNPLKVTGNILIIDLEVAVAFWIACNAARELREETGFTAERVRLLGTMMPNPAINSAYCHVVLAQRCHRTKEPQLDPFEKIEVLVRPLDQVTEMIRSGEISHALVIAAFGLMDKHKK